MRSYYRLRARDLGPRNGSRRHRDFLRGRWYLVELVAPMVVTTSHFDFELRSRPRSLGGKVGGALPAYQIGEMLYPNLWQGA